MVFTGYQNWPQITGHQSLAVVGRPRQWPVMMDLPKERKERERERVWREKEFEDIILIF